MHRIKASQRAVLRAMLIQWEGQRKYFSLAGKPAGLGNFLCSDIVERAELILGTPLTPIAVLLRRRNNGCFCFCHYFSLFLFFCDVEATQIPSRRMLLAPGPPCLRVSVREPQSRSMQK